MLPRLGRVVAAAVLAVSLAVSLAVGLVAGLSTDVVPTSGPDLGGTTTAPADADPSGSPTLELDPGARTVTAQGLMAGQPDDRPNIVVIMTDDMRSDELAEMPHVRRLLGEGGVEFANSFSPLPLCCPARASFLTGRYTHNHGVWANRRPYAIAALDDSSTVATDLAAAGYQTAFLGKYLNRYAMDLPPHRTGDPLRYIPPGWDDWRGAVTSAPGTTEPGGAYSYFRTTLNMNGTLRAHPRVYQTRVLGRETRDVVNGLSRSPMPFFLWSSFVAPHTGGPPESDDPTPVVRGNGTTVRLRTPARPPAYRGSSDAHVRGAVAEPDLSDKPSFLQGVPTLNRAEVAALTKVTRQRAESLRVVDEEVARMFAALEQTGELDDTVVFFTSDNGYLLGEHGWLMGKRTLYESAVRVPTLVAGPGFPAGEVRRDPFLTIDFTPTILELAGARTSRSMDGVSMLAVARHGDRGWRRPVLFETGPRRLPGGQAPALERYPGGPSSLRFSQAVRTPRYLYAEHATDERELYDLRADPLEMRNIVDRPDVAAVVAQLAAVLDRLRTCTGESCHDPLPRALQTP